MHRSIKLAEHDTVALVGSESLMGREIRDIVATSAAGFSLRLIAAQDEVPGQLTRVGDEPAIVIELDAEGLSGRRNRAVRCWNLRAILRTPPSSM